MLRIAFLFLAVLAPRAQEGMDYLCPKELSIDRWVNEASPIEFDKLMFFASVESSMGTIELVNESDRTIQYYLIILELLDSDGKHLLSVPVFNVDSEDNIPFRVAFRPWMSAHFSGGYLEPITAKARARKAFYIPLTMLTCPARARIAMIQLKYGDGTEFRASLASFNTQPVLTEVSPTGAAGYKRWAPLMTVGAIRVDLEGHGHLDTSDYQNPDFVRWLEQQIAKWKFAPSTVKGQAAPGAIPFVMIIGEMSKQRTQLDLLKKKGVSGTLLVLAAVPPESAFGDTWVLFAGGRANDIRE
jgi:hypothetical protein